MSDPIVDPIHDKRLEALELKLMDMELTLQQLNDVVLKQYQDIERLQAAHNTLLKRLDSEQDTTPTPSVADEVPPHY